MWLPCCHCRRRWCKGRGFVVLCLRGIGGVKDLSWTPWPFCWTFEDAVLGCCEIESRLSQLVERGSGCGIVGGSDRVYCGEWWLLSACDADQLIVEDKDFLLVAWEIWPVLKDDYFFFSAVNWKTEGICYFCLDQLLMIILKIFTSPALIDSLIVRKIKNSKF
jgi:hypothetical protein